MHKAWLALAVRQDVPLLQAKKFSSWQDRALLTNLAHIGAKTPKLAEIAPCNSPRQRRSFAGSNHAVQVLCHETSRKACTLDVGFTLTGCMQRAGLTQATTADNLNIQLLLVHRNSARACSAPDQNAKLSVTLWFVLLRQLNGVQFIQLIEIHCCRYKNVSGTVSQRAACPRYINNNARRTLTV